MTLAATSMISIAIPTVQASSAALHKHINGDCRRQTPLPLGCGGGGCSGGAPWFLEVRDVVEESRVQKRDSHLVYSLSGKQIWPAIDV